MEDVIVLRPIAEEDLLLLERLTQDPATAGEYAWSGWRNLLRFRQGWAEDSDDRTGPVLRNCCPTPA